MTTKSGQLDLFTEPEPPEEESSQSPEPTARPFDLVDAENWPTLLATDPPFPIEAMVQCLALHLADPFRFRPRESFGPEIARKILEAFGVPEPPDRSRSAFCSDNVWPAHLPYEGERGAWLAVHGLEDGLFQRDCIGRLEMSSLGAETLARMEAALPEPRVLASYRWGDLTSDPAEICTPEAIHLPPRTPWKCSDGDFVTSFGETVPDPSHFVRFDRAGQDFIDLIVARGVVLATPTGFDVLATERDARILRDRRTQRLA